MTAVLKSEVPPKSMAASNGKAKSTLVLAGHKMVRVPSIGNLAAFRRWVHSSDYPEKIRICYLAGELWVDLTMEEYYSHNLLKTEFTVVLGGLSKKQRRGDFLSDGMLVTNARADLSCEPDGMFVFYESFDAGRIRLVESKRGKPIELEGTPDMTLEIVSEYSITKDNVKLLQLYWDAGVPEYWLVDARDERLNFDILRHTPTGYVAVPKVAGWIKSDVFGKSFRLTRKKDERGNPKYTLKVK